MIKKRLTRNKVILFSVVIIVIAVGILVYILARPKNSLANKPNPTPGSRGVNVGTSTEAEQKQQTKKQILNQKLSEAPKDPKSRCEIIAKFNAETMRDDNITFENNRHDEYIKKSGNSRAEDYIHKQSLERIQKQYDRSMKNIKCD